MSMRMPYLSSVPHERKPKIGREVVFVEIPRMDFAKRGRAYLSAWGGLEEVAEDKNMRIVMKSRRVIDKGPMIRLECEITHCEEGIS